MASTLRGEDWQVHAGAVVPAYAVPDHINFDGRATFYPGTYDSGSKQGESRSASIRRWTITSTSSRRCTSTGG